MCIRDRRLHPAPSGPTQDSRKGLANMEKLLSDYRKNIGEFEVIDFEDEAIVQGVRSRMDVDVPVDLHWTWSYESEIDELRRLYEKGKAGQWNAQTDLDWDTPIERSDWILNPEFSLMANVVKMFGGSEAAQKEATRRDRVHALAAAPRRAGRAPALRPADQRLHRDRPEVLCRQPGDRRGPAHRGPREVPR